MWRADHWYNKPVKKATRPSKEDYSYYFTHNISITTSGNFNTAGLKFCIDQIGAERCLYSIGKPLVSKGRVFRLTKPQTTPTTASPKLSIGG